MPATVVQECQKNACKSIAYTYSEPVAFLEYARDTARLARTKGMRNIWISNGYINEKPLRDVAQYLHAANINLKSFSDEIYTKLNGGTLQPVLTTLKITEGDGGVAGDHEPRGTHLDRQAGNDQADVRLACEERF